MKLNACANCGATTIGFVTEGNEVKAVCTRCGRSGRPANMKSPKLAELANKHADEMRETIKELAAEAWNKQNPESRL